MNFTRINPEWELEFRYEHLNPKKTAKENR